MQSGTSGVKSSGNHLKHSGGNASSTCTFSNLFVQLFVFEMFYGTLNATPLIMQGNVCCVLLLDRTKCGNAYCTKST